MEQGWQPKMGAGNLPKVGSVGGLWEAREGKERLLHKRAAQDSISEHEQVEEDIHISQ